MKQFSPTEIECYNALMLQVALQVYQHGTQKQMAARLGIHPSTLNKALHGVITLDSRTFIRLLDFCGFVVFKGIESSDGTIYPTLNLI